MLGSETLEVGVGVIFFFLLVSLICTAVREAFEAVMKTRAMDLERGLRELLADPGGTTIAKAVFDHPMVSSLFMGTYAPQLLKKSRDILGVPKQVRMPWAARRDLPSYIPSGHFASALLDVMARGPVTSPSNAPGQQTIAATTPLTISSLRATAATFPNEQVKRAILFAIDTAEGDLNKAKENVEAWFNGTMDRVSGWYKRRTQRILFFLGFIAAVVLNLDAITVTEHLALDKTLRQTAVAEAQAISTKGSLPQGAEISALESKIRDIGYPIGWTDGWPGPQSSKCPSPNNTAVAARRTTTEPACRRMLLTNPFSILLGWLITAFAVMLGAPFWFDILNKFMIVRSTIKPSQKSPPEGSIEPQQKSTTVLSSAAPAGEK